MYSDRTLPPILYVDCVKVYSLGNMDRRATLPVGLLAVICSLPYSVHCNGQVPSVPDRCSVSAPSSKVDSAWRKVIIKRIDFGGPIRLSKSDVAGIIREANKTMLNAEDPDWIKEFTEANLREAWLTHGYFKVYMTAQASSLSGNSNEERFLVAAHVEEGSQYHLRDIRFRGVTDTRFGDDLTFPEATLRAAIPIRDGEIFNVALIRNGIEALTKLYNSKGYINFTAVPDTEVDDDLRPLISLVFALDPEQQFHVGKVEMMALDPKLEARLREIVRPGEIFNPEAIKDFFKENKSVFPSRPSPENLRVLRNVKAGIADLTFDFRPCP